MRRGTGKPAVLVSRKKSKFFKSCASPTSPSFSAGFTAGLMANLAYIQITRECNQLCRFCSNPPTKRVISFARVRRLMDTYQAQGYAGVIFSGGEPTLYPHLENAFAYAREKK